ncbi:zinc ribbon domain-containing protein [Dethiothermospora halolimnae]|uniref:zinc ribbon domain-containing protein n=1 Tax=Dethiothermospora halolimnae TaxID=3114390 RepID=UPI003CCBC183
MKERGFKVLFITLTTVIIGVLAVFYGFIITEMFRDPFTEMYIKIPMVLLLLLPIGLIIGIASFINRDAPKYGMDKWKWMTIGTYVPNLLGLIIYLVVRSNRRKEKVCVNCGETVDKTFGICPYCGQKLDKSCDNCGKAVKEEWKVCPYCEEKL